MNIQALFRNKQPVDNYRWITGGQEHTFLAVRNRSGKAQASAMLVKAVVACLQGQVTKIVHADLTWRPDAASITTRCSTGLMVTLTSSSKKGTHHLPWITCDRAAVGYPYARDDSISYMIGVLALVDGFFFHGAAPDLLAAYGDLLQAYQHVGAVDQRTRDEILLVADELYYWLRYRDDCTRDLAELTRTLPDKLGLCDKTHSQLDPQALSDWGAFAKATTAAGATPKAIKPKPKGANPAQYGDFIGWQGPALAQAVKYGDNCLLAGPTGTGKTYLTELIAIQEDFSLVTIEGKEGLQDLDFLGAILPQEDASRRWVDGPILRAMRAAQIERVLLFLDEVNRIPREHINLLLGLMNPKSGDVCRLAGMQVPGDGPFYVIEVPMTSQVVLCPAAHLRIVAAGNFGSGYAVYDLDPAVRRRFETVIEFAWLGLHDEIALICKKAPLSNEKLAKLLASIAQETRRLWANGELPGAIDPASLIVWAKKVRRSKAISLEEVMLLGKLTWADTVCGRDHTGALNSGNFEALADYAQSLGLAGFSA